MEIYMTWENTLDIVEEHGTNSVFSIILTMSKNAYEIQKGHVGSGGGGGREGTAWLAQSVEHANSDLRVMSSSPISSVEST